MKVKQNYVLKEIADQYVVVPIAEEAIRFNGIISLNKTGKRLFQKLQTEQSEKDLVDYLVSVYEVEPDKAKEDVLNFIKTLKEKNILE